MYLTKDDLKELIKQLLKSTIKDSEFDSVSSTDSLDEVVIVLKGKNVKVNIKDLQKALMRLVEYKKGSVYVEDHLFSYSAENALSANMGRILGEQDEALYDLILQLINYRDPTPFKGSVSITPSSFYYGQIVSPIFDFSITGYSSYLQDKEDKIQLSYEDVTTTLAEQKEIQIIKEETAEPITVAITISTDELDFKKQKPANYILSGTCAIKYKCGVFASANENITEIPQLLQGFDYTTNVQTYNVPSNGQYIYVVIPKNVPVSLIWINTINSNINSSLLLKKADILNVLKVEDAAFDIGVDYLVWRSTQKLNIGNLYFKIN